MAEVKKTTKKVVKPAAKPAVKKAEPKKVEAKSTSAKATVDKKVEAAVKVSTHSAGSGQASKKSISLDVYGLDGKAAGKVSVAGEIFDEEINKPLIAQAVRVYQANKRQGNASTKTRGEVDGSTRKIYRQKGTGRARHGSVRAPIFVKGGIVFGPKPRDFSLALPNKMKQKALFSALSAKVKAKELKVVSGFEAMTPKTKNLVTALQKLEVDGKNRSVLLVTVGKSESVKRASGNAVGVVTLPANLLNAYDVIKNKNVIVMKEALTEIEKTFLAKK